MRGRIRTIKPDIGKHEDLWDLGVETGLPVYQAYTLLWCYADREGRFEWRPRSLKTDILPYWEGDFSRVLDALVTRGFIVRYAFDGREFGCIPSFSKHQVLNNREAPSELPSPNDSDELTRGARVNDACPTPLIPAQGEWKGMGMEGNGSGNDASRDAPDNDDPPSRSHSKSEPTRPDNPVPGPPSRAPGTPPAPRRDVTTTLRPSEWAPSPEGVAYARELGLDDPSIETTITELRNWKGTRAFTVDWWDAKWVTFVENRAQWLKEPKPRKARTPAGDGSEMAKAREAMAFLRGDEPVRAEVV